MLVHPRGAGDLAGIHDPLWVKGVLHLGKSRDQLRAEHLGDPLATGQAIAVLSRHSAPVLAHHVAHALLNLAQKPYAFGVFEAEDRADVQQADARVPIVFGLNPQFLHQRDHSAHVVGQLGDRDAGVLYPGLGLGIALHAHQKPQPGLAQPPDGLLIPGIYGPRKRIAHPARAQSLLQFVQLAV